MATFQSKPGFKPVKHVTGAPYNGQSTMYVVGAAVNLVPGDIVMLEGTGSSTGLSTVTIATAAAIPVGVVTQIVNAKLDPLSGKMTAGSITLDTPQFASSGSLVMVADDPGLICETEIATYVQADVNRNFELVPTTYNTTTGNSNMKIIGNGYDQADPFRLLGIPQKNDKLSGNSFDMPVDGDLNVKVLVAFNTHAYGKPSGNVSV